VQKQLIQSGFGDLPPDGSLVTVHYRGFHGSRSKMEFDSSLDGEPFSFTIGAGEVIACWDKVWPDSRAHAGDVCYGVVEFVYIYKCLHILALCVSMYIAA
jgi:hypothetical protein